MSLNESKQQEQLHLCVLVHGLWGNPAHLSYVAEALLAEHPDLHVMMPKTNAGGLTYDGIEVGGERVTEEIEHEIAELEAAGKTVTQISVVGYSLGGLISRYALGLLYSRGLFERIEPVNFTTFATPHLGVRSPVLGLKNQLYNVLGARTLSATGAQLFGIDNFNNTGRPLLAVLADPSSIFVKGLTLFKKRTLYANIINDRSVTFYTSCLARHDPFVNLDAVTLNEADGYEGVILDSDNPATPKVEKPTAYESFSNTARSIANTAPYALAMTVFLPIGITAYLVNSGWQSYASTQRVREHETKAAPFRSFPLIIETARRHAEHAVETLAASGPGEDYLPEHAATNGIANGNGHAHKEVIVRSKTEPADVAPLDAEGQQSWPTLALTPAQFEMIDTLRPMFERYPVHITKAMHSHAAIIRRMNRESFSEGRVVARHWVERFLV